MDPLIFLLLLLASSIAHMASVIAQPTNPVSRITVVGVVYCDMCSNNKFSRHSYFLPGVDVNIRCKFKATSPKTLEQMTVSVNRTTGKYGVYKVEIPNVDGVDCVEGLAIESVCQASLIGGSTSACNVPALKTSTNQISIKSKQDNHCIYSLSALSYRPPKRNPTLCGNHRENVTSDPTVLNPSNFVLPFGWPPSLPFPFPPIPTDWVPNFPSFSPSSSSSSHNKEP